MCLCTGEFSFFLCLWLHAEAAVVQDLCLVEGDRKIEICRGKWGFFSSHSSRPWTGATLRCHIMQRWLSDWSWGHPGSAVVAGWSWLMKLRMFLFFEVFVFYLAPSLIFLIHVKINKEKTHCGLIEFLLPCETDRSGQPKYSTYLLKRGSSIFRNLPL